MIIIVWIGQRFSYVGDYVHAHRWLVYLIGLPISFAILSHVVAQVRADRRQHGVPVQNVVYAPPNQRTLRARANRADVEPEKELT